MWGSKMRTSGPPSGWSSGEVGRRARRAASRRSGCSERTLLRQARRLDGLGVPAQHEARVGGDVAPGGGPLGGQRATIPASLGVGARRRARRRRRRDAGEQALEDGVPPGLVVQVGGPAGPTAAATSRLSLVRSASSSSGTVVARSSGAGAGRAARRASRRRRRAVELLDLARRAAPSRRSASVDEQLAAGGVDAAGSRVPEQAARRRGTASPPRPGRSRDLPRRGPATVRRRSCARSLLEAGLGAQPVERLGRAEAREGGHLGAGVGVAGQLDGGQPPEADLDEGAERGGEVERPLAERQVLVDAADHVVDLDVDEQVAGAADDVGDGRVLHADAVARGRG